MENSDLDQQLQALSEQALLALPTFAQWLQQNVKEFELDAMPDEFKDARFDTMRLTIIRRDDFTWGVRDRLERILSRDGRWLQWPIPSEEVAGVRFTLPEAIAAARAELPKLRHMGMDSRQLAEWARKRWAEMGVER